jgi:hypothetical protein
MTILQFDEEQKNFFLHISASNRMEANEYLATLIAFIDEFHAEPESLLDIGETIVIENQ